MSDYIMSYADYQQVEGILHNFLVNKIGNPVALTQVQVPPCESMSHNGTTDPYIQRKWFSSTVGAIVYDYSRELTSNDKTMIAVPITSFSLFGDGWHVPFSCTADILTGTIFTTTYNQPMVGEGLGHASYSGGHLIVPASSQQIQYPAQTIYSAEQELWVLAFPVVPIDLATPSCNRQVDGANADSNIGYYLRDCAASTVEDILANGQSIIVDLNIVIQR